MEWTRISQILCMFGFLKEFRPSEPFIYNYLTSHGKNFTDKQVNQEIYPIATYSNFATLVVVFLLTDFLRYKPVIILCGISGIAAYIILIVGNSIPIIQVVEFLYGLYFSTEVAYYTYIYAKVDKEHYQIVSSYIRSALLFGRFITGVVAQLTISFSILNYHELNYLTLLGQVLATLWAVFLPSVKQSVYFHRPEDSPDKDDCITNSRVTTEGLYPNQSFIQKTKRAYYLLWKDFIKAYTNIHVLKWSFWWAAASCGYLQVLSYAQIIWETCVKTDDIIYNGAVEAFYTIIGGLTVFGVGKLQLNWELLGEIILSFFSIIEAILLFFMTKTYNIWLQYTLYIIFGVIYHTIVTIASFEVAKNISEDSFGLIFGINVFLGLTFQSILTFIVIGGNHFLLDIRGQFTVYSAYFGVLGAIFGVIAVFTITSLCRRQEKLTIWTEVKDDRNSH
ncbi:thiamine transporter 2-like [Chelonus insularis]|uniref:thiamine transporter 2-like n=1 Tax=Chelonus insularis TaxID=460826 RepID=UPI00158E64E5|nr:thiamine transporter 2-like [Chelonus insularis]